MNYKVIDKETYYRKDVFSSEINNKEIKAVLIDQYIE